MSKTAKVFAIVLGSAAVVLLGSSLLLAWTVATQGVVQIAVDDRESGTHFNVPVPAALVGAGLHLSPCARQRLHMGHGAEIEKLRPALASFFEVLGDAPDAVLVDMRDGDDWVQIRKAGRNFEIQVRNPDSDIRLSLPVRLLRQVVRETV